MDTLSADLISVIVPVYNIESYVLDCLESIAVQTYSNLECIIIDDGSTDSSGKICDRFCCQDSRFQVIHQENSGLGPARNTGYVNAHGKYVMFIDGDDMLTRNALETTHKCIESGPYDVFIFGLIRTDITGKIIEPTDEQPGHQILSGEDASHILFFGPSYEKTVFVHVCGKLFLKSVLDGLVAKHYYAGEDLHFVFRLLQRRPSILYQDKKLYLWRQRPNSISHLNKAKQRYWSFLAFKDLEISLSDDSAFRSIYLRKAYREMIVTRFHLSGSEYYPSFLDECLALKKRIQKEYLMNTSIPFAEKILLSVLWCFPQLASFVFRRMGN